MEIQKIASELIKADENVVVVYAFNSTGKTRLSVALKDLTKTAEGRHTGVYYNAFSEDLYSWDNGDGNEDGEIRLNIGQSSLNGFHGSLKELDVEEHLQRYKPSYNFRFVLHDDLEDGIKYVRFFRPDHEDEAIKVSRGEERIFVWCFFLALFEVDEFSGVQSSHIFIDDPVSSLDDHNIFITASTIFDLIENNYEKKKIIITTHHVGLFSILSDWLKKGEKATKYEKVAKLFILTNKNGETKLESCRKDVFLYHLRLLQVLEQARADKDLRSFHLALLRQVLENVSSFLGVGRISYVLEQIGVEDSDRAVDIVNRLSHKNVYYFESDDLVQDNEELLVEILDKLKAKYQFVLHS